MNKLHIKYIILFFGIIFIIDFTCGRFLNKNFNNINFGDFGEINRGLKTDAEILIIGSSRAMHHYNPKILSEALNLSCYNAGIGGHGLFLNYAMLSENIKTNSPKIVILDLSPNVIVDKNSYSKLNSLLPYYEEHESFKEIIQLNPEFSKLELISNLYIYNSTLYDLVRGYFLESRNPNLGFSPLKDVINEKNFIPFYLDDEEIDNNKIIYFNKIINLCKSKNIKLIVVVSPTFTKFDRENRIINKFNHISEKNNIEFLDYSNFYQKSEYFIDQLHLNGLGADIFTKDLVLDIKL